MKREVAMCGAGVKNEIRAEQKTRLMYSTYVDEAKSPIPGSTSLSMKVAELGRNSIPCY